MIVYIESNFVLELALEQEEADCANEILKLAKDNLIVLSIPLFSISEPYDTVIRRGRERKKICRDFSEHLNQLYRTNKHKDIVESLMPTITALLKIETTQLNSLEQIISSILRKGRVLNLDFAVFQDSLAYQKQYSLLQQDAIIYATIINDLHYQEYSMQKVFVSKNPKDFGNPGIREELKIFNCKYFSNFLHALSYIKSQL